MAYILVDYLDKNFGMAERVMALIGDKLTPSEVRPNWAIFINDNLLKEIWEIDEGYFAGKLCFLDPQGEEIKFFDSTEIKIFKIEQSTTLQAS